MMQRLNLPLALLLTAALLGPVLVRAEVRPPSLVPPAAPKSAFTDDLGFGKDPFFPNSGRRPKVQVHAADPEPPRVAVPDFITLKGISVIKDRRLAIINNYTVAENEEFSVRYGSQIFKIKCVEIKERSVTVSVNGLSKELPLRSTFN
jgi:hypothetical protein